METTLHAWQVEAIDLFEKQKKLIVNAATGCLCGDTLIDMPRDLTKYPGGVPITSLVGKKDFYVYSFNITNSKIELKKCSKVWQSKKNAEVFKITTSSGRSIIATEDHPFLVDIRKTNSVSEHTSGRIYRALKDLTIGTYLTVFNRSKWDNPKNYNLLRIEYDNYSHSRKTWGKMEEHKFILSQLGRIPLDTEIIHHKDHNKNNNSVNNLEILDAKTHNSIHTKERGLFGKSIWPNGEHPKGFLGHTHSMQSRKEISTHLYDKYNKKEYLPTRMVRSSFPVKSFKIFKTPIHAQISRTRSIEGLKKLDRDSFSERCANNSAIRYFDKIVSIEYFGKMDVYDMTVEENHNFIANGMIVHNCGKTIMGIECIKRLREQNPDYNILIVAPKIVILETVWLKELNANGLGPNKVGMYYGYAKEFSKITLTTIASIPHLDMSIFDVIICDEIHNMMSPNLRKLLKHTFEYMLGLSASIKTIDQRHWKLLEAFDYNIYEYGIREAIKDKIINKFNYNNVGVRIIEPEVLAEYERIEHDLKQYLKAYGGFEKILRMSKDNPVKNAVLGLFGQRNDLVNNYARKIDIVCDIIAQNKDKKIILFSQYNKITRGIYWALKEKIGRAEIIDTNIKPALRDKFLKEFEGGLYNVLLSSRIFEEGYNLPAIDLAIFLSSNSTNRQMIQRLGRILRKKDKPSDAYYIYCIDTFEEDYANRAKGFVTEVAERIIEVKH